MGYSCRKSETLLIGGRFAEDFADGIEEAILHDIEPQTAGFAFHIDHPPAGGTEPETPGAAAWALTGVVEGVAFFWRHVAHGFPSRMHERDDAGEDAGHGQKGAYRPLDERDLEFQ